MEKFIAQWLQLTGAVNVNLGQLNAHIRQIADRAGRGEISFWEGLQSSLIAFEAKKGLPFRPAVIALGASISGAGAANSGSDNYRISPSEDFVVDQLLTSIVQEAQESEPAVAATLGTNIAPSERSVMKLLNARGKLSNKDTGVAYFESDANSGIGLANFCPAIGGAPLQFRRGSTPTFIVPANTSLKWEVTLASANAAYNTASTEYGILLVGQYVNRKYLNLDR